MKKKTVALLLALVLCAGCAVGGTVAWLTTKTAPVVNTFTTSDITITLEETATDGGTATANSYKMVPGDKIEKDPKVTVATGSEACWLFVKLEETDPVSKDGSDPYTFDEFLSYAIADGWTELTTDSGIYYREIDTPDGTAISVIKGDKLTVNENVTKVMMNAIDQNPKLTVTAYAVQKLGFTNAAAAWDEAKKLG